MPWYAKPAGAYGYGSTEGRANITMMNGYFNSYNYSIESQAGIMGNVVAESGLNPWRWQSDVFNARGGYGLFQFTPAYSRDGRIGYIDTCQDLAGYGPNLSPLSVTTGARPEDGWAQLEAFNLDRLGKWQTVCWRNYWDRNTYASLWDIRRRVVTTYGDGNSLTLSQFKQITDIYDATFAFLACYEGPLYPTGYWDRCNNAAAIYQYLTGTTPPSPPGPGPAPYPTGSSFKIMLYLKPKRKRLI